MRILPPGISCEKSLTRTLLHAPFYASLLLLLSLVGCTKDPVTEYMEPRNPLAGQIILIQGTRVLATEILWDGDPNATPTVGAFAPYFQIPHNATEGPHIVKLRDSEGRESNEFSVDVDRPKGPFPAPRIEDIGIQKLSPTADGTFDMWLSVFSANADINAEISVDGVASTSVFYNAIPSGYFNKSSSPSEFDSHYDETFEYPVFHYAQHIAYLNVAGLVGQTISVQVRNGDHQLEPRPYVLPTDYATLDSDNDGLLDTWETEGYKPPGSTVTIDLQGMGCDPHRKDILVEVDWVAVHQPDDEELWKLIETAFAEAPILNPNGSQGIGIHIDHGQFGSGGGTLLDNHEAIGWPLADPDATVGYVSFHKYKAASFSPDRENIFHYCILGKKDVGGYSGRAEIWGNDFYISNPNAWTSVLAEAGTFIHELGHNIGLRHGGIDNNKPDRDVTYKPNQESIMNYRYQQTGVSVNCDYDPEEVLGFSRGMLKPIPKINVNNDVGICDLIGLTVSSITGPLAINDWGMTLYNHDEWGNLKLNFRLPGSRVLESDPEEERP